MKKIIKAISILLAVIMLFSFSSCAKLEEFFGTSKGDDGEIPDSDDILLDELEDRIPGAYSFLVVREGERAGSAGSFALAQISFSGETLSVFNIPENLFVKYGNSNSLGEIYEKEYDRVSALGLEKSERELSGAKAVSACVSEIFTLPVDYHIVFSRSAVVDIIDLLGGIQINLPFAFTTNVGNSYSAGQRKIDGEAAFDFMNYDLFENGRSQMNAVSEVLAGTHKKVISEITSENISLYMVQGKPLVSTDLPSKDGYDISFLRKLASVKFENWNITNICTSTVSTAGGNYEVARYSAVYSQISAFFSLSYGNIKMNTDSYSEDDRVFDKDKKMNDPSQMIVNAIYNSSATEPPVYTADEIYLGKLEIFQKK